MKFSSLIKAAIILCSFSACSSESEEQHKNKNRLSEKIGSFFKSPEAIAFPDTSAAVFEDLEISDGVLKEEITEKVKDFYRQNGYHSRWLYTKDNTELFSSFLEVLRDAHGYGLKPENYNADKLNVQVQQLYDESEPDDRAISDLDRKITASFLLFATHLDKGRILDPGARDTLWLKDKEEDFHKEVRLLLEIDDEGDVAKAVETLHPTHPFYKGLMTEMRKLKEGEPKNIHKFKLNDLKDFKPGYTDPNIALLRQNLQEWGIKVTVDSNANSVDEKLIEKIKEFQRSRGIKDDGLPGENTLLYLNMDDEELRELIELNLERMRWFPEIFDEEYILVNVPEFTLRIYEKEEVKMKMRVIVGDEYKPTPIFSDTLQYIVFRPTWTVPQSIINEEMIPKLIEDPEYYTRQNFKIYEADGEIDPTEIAWDKKNISSRYFKFIQQPDKHNSLGLVKFMMPNNLSIYLHDTPADHLFDRDERALSHGCVRLEKPDELAAYLLRDKDDWGIEKVRENMQEGDTKNVDLDKPFHVQIAYITTWVDENNQLRIAEDIYGHDRRQLEELRQF